MNTENATPELFDALAKAQGQIENATKNAQNPHFRNNYADLAEVLNTIRPVFSSHGLSVIQSTAFDGALVSVTTMVAHASGGFITSTASCVPAKSDAQAVGSATTYLRRYALSAMAGVSQEDDDGNSAAHNAKPEPVSERQQAQASDFAEAIAQALDLDALNAIGQELAKARLPQSLVMELRAKFGARVKELKQ